MEWVAGKEVDGVEVDIVASEEGLAGSIEMKTVEARSFEIQGEYGRFFTRRVLVARVI